MRYTLFRIVMGCYVASIVTCCSENKNLDSWLGNYKYEEQSIKAIAGYYMVMSWDLSVKKINDKYSSILNVNGQQTGSSCINKIIGNDSTLFLIYDQLLDGINHTLNKGDTLFALSKTVTRVKTKWKVLKPILAEFSPEECECFVFTGTNTNKNILNTNR